MTYEEYRQKAYGDKKPVTLTVKDHKKLFKTVPSEYKITRHDKKIKK
jgi:hypothetical protein